jgi:hypothetical protein
MQFGVNSTILKMSTKYNYSAITNVCHFISNTMLYVTLMVRIDVIFVLISLKHRKKISSGLIIVKSLLMAEH